jgi:predicted alpha/beta superfamily hydrolase
MHDGQNLFDPETAFGGRDWQIARTMDKMPLAKQLIIVGIDNGEENRINEYAPFESENGGGEGDAYLQFIAETLKPVIDSEYRTMPEKEATGIAGSSMGGLISFYAGLRYSSVFGKIGVLSPALWVNPTVINILENGLDPQSRFYVVASKTESKTMESTLTAVYWALKNAGLSDGDLRVIVRDRGKHNEIFWGREFRQMVEWLF